MRTTTTARWPCTREPASGCTSSSTPGRSTASRSARTADDRGTARGDLAARRGRALSEVATLQRVSFFVDKAELLGVLHLPSGEGAGSALVLHGFGGDPAQPHIQTTCAALAGVGVAALRFAYRDHRPPRMTLASALEDARGALRLLRAHPACNTDRLALVGFSFGGAVAALLAGGEKAVRASVLAAATADGEGKQAPLDAIVRTRGDVLLLWGTADTVVPTAHAERYRLALGRVGIRHELVTIDGADHDFGPSATTLERTSAAIARWVRERL